MYFIIIGLSRIFLGKITWGEGMLSEPSRRYGSAKTYKIV
jgi:hypothetical protein